MSLERYRRKRDFARTPEPPGASGEALALGRAPAPGRRFVVQRHRARRLHYDLRLEIDGVLVSWAVPRGPTLDPSARRMAVHVEDHPLEYFDFEGTIPGGQYGAGDAIVWDWGTFEPEVPGDPGAAVRAGELKFRLHGVKLTGRFTIVHTGRGPGGSRDREGNWLLVKKRDEAAVPGWDPEAHPRSVKTGRTNDEVAAGAIPAATPLPPAPGESPAAGATLASAVPADASPVGVPGADTAPELAGAREEPMPEFVEPMQATLAAGPFSDPDWLFEVKWDGYRVEAVVRDGRVRLWTRTRQDAARYFPWLAGAPDWIAAGQAIVDGEVVALRPDGTADFGLLQELSGARRRRPGRVREASDLPPAPGAGWLAYEVFDLLYCDGRSLVDAPLEDRKRLLRARLRPHPMVRYAGHVEGDGEAFFRAVAERGVEGMVAKLRRSRYEPGRRSRAWCKVKVRPEQELVLVGYLPGTGRASDLGALLAGVHADGELRYAGRVGSGFDASTRRTLLDRLDPLRRPDPPIAHPPDLPAARWTEPRLVMRVAFAGWTRDGLVRQAAYKGLELDRDPLAVVRERPDRGAGPAVSQGAHVAAVPVAPADPATSDAAERALPAAVSGTSFAPATADELEALERLPARGGRWHVGGQVVSLTNLDRVLFPAVGLTKRDLVRYYVTIGPKLLPYLAGRALNLTRWPEGVDGPHFWQKEIPPRAPAWVARASLPGRIEDDAHTYVVADSVATLAWLANMAAIEVHPWTSPATAPDRPSYALIDIDPGERTSWAETALLARLHGDALRHLRVTGYPKLTGKRGVQVWVPVKPIYTFEETRRWVEALSRAVGATVPGLVSREWEKTARGGLARLDYTQNASNRTLVAPYGVRAWPNASVSAPIGWDELDDPDLRADRWTVVTIGERLRDRGDLFRGVLEQAQELPPL